jgi:hypothetical protein
MSICRDSSVGTSWTTEGSEFESLQDFSISPFFILFHVLTFGLVDRFIDQLQVVIPNNYNTTAISTTHSTLENTVQSRQSVTRHFLVTVPTMAIPLPPAQVLSSQNPVQN